MVETPSGGRDSLFFLSPVAGRGLRSLFFPAALERSVAVTGDRLAEFSTTAGECRDAERMRRERGEKEEKSNINSKRVKSEKQIN